MEDGDTLLVAGGQHGTGNRYRDNFIERSMRAFVDVKTWTFLMNAASPIHGCKSLRGDTMGNCYVS